MIKYVYKVVILFFVFCGAVFFFGNNMPGQLANEGKKITVQKESFPVLTIQTQNQTINALYGYSGSMDPAVVRQSITPLDGSKTIQLNMIGEETNIQKLKYAIIDKESGDVYVEEEISGLDSEKKQIKIQFDYAFHTSTEYILAMTATTDQGRRIHYYSRLKFYQDDTNLSGKLKFAMDFHEKTFNKEATDDLKPFLETNIKMDNSTLAKVNINSDVDLITWAKLKPSIVSDIIPTVKEYNSETACIQLSYFAEASTDTGKERYLVKEFYRVRYTSSRYFLLAFERTMETVYNSKYVSTNLTQLKVGITQDTDMQLVTSEDKKHLFFAKSGILYHYNMENNSMEELFSAWSQKVKDIYAVNDEVQIRINKIGSDNSIYFTVFGYLPRGEYEGKVAVVLYKYTMESQKLEELVYMPMNTTYQQLKEDFHEYSYVNSKGIYYFTVGNVAYSYNFLGKRLEKLKENVTEKGFSILANKNSYAWSSSSESGYGDEIEIYNLETDEKKSLVPPNNKTYIRLLGTIDSNVVCGYVRKSDIVKSTEGTEIVPCYRMEIIDTDGNVLKTYKLAKAYISNVSVNGNVLSIERCRKNGKNSYRTISSDSILNQTTKEKNAVTLTARVTSQTLTEWYITLPSSFVLTKAPDLLQAKDIIITAERAIHLEDMKVRKYYVYALGKITGAYENPTVAIQAADNQMGVVISSDHKLVWERGGSFLMNSISGIENIKVSHDITSIGACAYMLLKADHIDVKAKELSVSKKSVYDMLNQYMEHPVNLTGCNLEQVLYFVSSGKPVVGMTGKNTAVVISEYTTANVTVINPNSGKSETVSRSTLAKIFEDAGNKFISYMN